MLDVGDDNLIYWEECGNHNGKLAVLHGGPGSGCTAWWRRLFNPRNYTIILFDQRKCGRSKPSAAALETDLTKNNTMKLISDIENLRQELSIDKWLLMGGSWGSTLALSYAETYPTRVSEMILFGVTTGIHQEFDWLFRGGVARFFPEQWDRFKSNVPLSLQHYDIVEAYSQLLNNPDPEVRQRAAQAWCEWESATPEMAPSNKIQERYKKSNLSLSFARLVTPLRFP